MSEGPIQREREAWEPKRVTTDPKTSVHAFRPDLDWRRGYCGRASLTQTDIAAEVTCSDCLAALRADGEIS